MLCARHLYRRRSFLTKAGAQCSWSDWPRSERCTGNYRHFPNVMLPRTEPKLFARVGITLQISTCAPNSMTRLGGILK